MYIKDKWDYLVSRKGITVNFTNTSHISRIVANHIRQVPEMRHQKIWVLVLRNQIIPFLYVCAQAVECYWRKTTHWANWFNFKLMITSFK